MKKKPIIKSMLLLAALFILSCEKSKNANLEEKRGSTEHVGSESQILTEKESHQILSVWYLDQYEAVDILNGINGVTLEVGSKVRSSPKDILTRQLSLLDELATEDLNSTEFATWIELQESVTKNLCSKVHAEYKVLDKDAKPLIRGKNLIGQQMRIIEKITLQGK